MAEKITYIRNEIACVQDQESDSKTRGLGCAAKGAERVADGAEETEETEREGVRDGPEREERLGSLTKLAHLWEAGQTEDEGRGRRMN